MMIDSSFSKKAQSVNSENIIISNEDSLLVPNPIDIHQKSYQ